MSKKLTFKSIERQINGEYHDLDARILFSKEKVILELLDSMNAQQYNIFKKYLSYEKKIQAAICKDLMHKCIKAIIDNPEKYDFSDIKNDSTTL